MITTPDVGGLLSTVDRNAHGALGVAGTSAKPREKVSAIENRIKDFNLRSDVGLNGPRARNLLCREVIHVVWSVSRLV